MRVIVNVAVGRRWMTGQDRLKQSFRGEEMRLWSGSLPPGCPQVRTVPYAFKPFALKAVNAETMLWLDASMTAGPRPLADLWEKIEQDGYYVCLCGWTNEQWTIPSAYQYLFPGVPMEEARAINATIPHILTGCLGLDMRHQIARCFLDEWYRLATTGAFIGPWYNRQIERFQNHERAGQCGDDQRVLGHRHDQTAASVIAWRLGMKPSSAPEMFSYEPREGEEVDMSRVCVIAKGV